MARQARLDLVKHGNGGTYLPGRTVAALVPVVPHERFLHGMHRVRRAQPLDGSDLVAVMHDGQGQTAVDPPPRNDHRARTTLAVIAAFLAARQLNVLT